VEERWRYSGFTESNNQQGKFDWQGKDQGMAKLCHCWYIKRNMEKTIGEIYAGKDFRTGTNGADAMGFVVNESAAKMMEFKDPYRRYSTLDEYDFILLVW